MKKFSKKTFKRKLHALWSLYIRTRDNFTCQWCGKQCEKGACDAHHIIPKGRCGNVGRYDIRNGMTLCSPCHLWKSKSNYVEFARFVEKWLKNRGINYNTLSQQYRGAIIKDNHEWYESKSKTLQEMLGELNKQDLF